MKNKVLTILLLTAVSHSMAQKTIPAKGIEVLKNESALGIEAGYDA